MKWLLLLLLLISRDRVPTWTPEMDALAHETETEFHLPHGTCRAFARQESGYDSNATRVETGYFNNGSRYARQITQESMDYLSQMVRPSDNDSDTDNAANEPLAVERAQRSISYGLFQLLGESFRHCGYDKPLIAPTLREQFYYFGIFTSDLFRRYHTLAHVASAFNTGNPNKTGRQYVKNVLKYQKMYAY